MTSPQGHNLEAAGAGNVPELSEASIQASRPEYLVPNDSAVFHDSLPGTVFGAQGERIELVLSEDPNACGVASARMTLLRLTGQRCEQKTLADKMNYAGGGTEISEFSDFTGDFEFKSTEYYIMYGDAFSWDEVSSALKGGQVPVVLYQRESKENPGTAIAHWSVIADLNERQVLINDPDYSKPLTYDRGALEDQLLYALLVSKKS